jgi:hypothetical protein
MRMEELDPDRSRDGCAPTRIAFHTIPDVF